MLTDMEHHPHTPPLREATPARITSSARRTLQWRAPHAWQVTLRDVTVTRGQYGPSLRALGVVRRNAQAWAELGVLHKIMVGERRETVTHTRAILLTLMVASAAQHAAQQERGRRPMLLKLFNRGADGVTLSALEQEVSAGTMSLQDLERRINQLAPRHWRGWGHAVSRAWQEHDRAAGQVSVLSAHLSTQELQDIVHGHFGALPLTSAPTRARTLSAQQLARLWPTLEAGLRRHAPPAPRQVTLN